MIIDSSVGVALYAQLNEFIALQNGPGELSLLKNYCWFIRGFLNLHDFTWRSEIEHESMSIAWLRLLNS